MSSLVIVGYVIYSDTSISFLNFDPSEGLKGLRYLMVGTQVAGLKAIHTFATDFESTSAVIGSGLDLFTSVVAPSRKFDQLGDEFNKAQLILTATGLLVGVLGLRPVVSFFFSFQTLYNTLG